MFSTWCGNSRMAEAIKCFAPDVTIPCDNSSMAEDKVSSWNIKVLWTQNLNAKEDWAKIDNNLYQIL